MSEAAARHSERSDLVVTIAMACMWPRCRVALGTAAGRRLWLGMGPTVGQAGGGAGLSGVEALVPG